MDSLAFPTLISIDLRPFHPGAPDSGVQAYMNKLGFKPDTLIFLNFFVDFLHTHTEIDDTPINKMNAGQRGTPTPFPWTRKDLFNLVNAVKNAGIRPLLGILSFTSSDVWQSARVDEIDTEIYQTKRGNQKMWGNCINPLKHGSDGSLYEDRFIADLMTVIEDYGFEGYVAGDGMMGLRGPRETLEDSDFSLDMVRQFQQYSEVVLPHLDDYDERANYITEHYFAEWVQFYVYRWGEHFGKLSSKLKPLGKALIGIDAWSRNPEESITAFGIDYRVLYEKGLEGVLVRAGEANKIRKHREGDYVWEENSIYTFLSHKAYEPRLQYYWAVSTVNQPEFWNAVLDLPHVMEREAFAYLWTMYGSGETGRFERAIDGLAVIWGNDISTAQWDWLTSIWNRAFHLVKQFERPVGLTLLWNDKGTGQHTSENKQYGHSFSKLLNEGICVHSAVEERNIRPFLGATGYLVALDPDILLREPQLEDRTFVILSNRIRFKGEIYPWAVGVRLIKGLCGVHISKGRMVGFEAKEGTFVFSLENAANLYYETAQVHLPVDVEEIFTLESDPQTQLRIVDNSSRIFSLPPDGAVQIAFKMKGATGDEFN
ncbi:hypothetical protein [Paenibacillus herberti]|uniref:Uncharacterized protein n=1 Tax=Paenibacillus herberti TaxID=1619309 RepID=A0A229NX41_9BACL|nr:hypothetical protein [Paenibacillus herberti]OXM14566.1 hypothetical protein CGZ75_16685 [Paenibacillus herberti]